MVKDSINKSITGIKSYLEDEIKNKPFSIAEYTAYPKKEKCLWCNYREVCDDKIL